MPLSDLEKAFVRQNYQKCSLRQIAKELDCSRPEIEKYVATLSSQAVAATGRLVPKIRAVFLASVIVFMTFLVYADTVGYEFVWDDTLQIQKNLLIRDHSLRGFIRLFEYPVGVVPGSKEYTSSSYRPIQSVSYWVNHLVSGTEPSVYRLTNIAFQAIAAVLLFFLLFCLLDNKEIAFWAAALFAVHPVQIAAVAYISGRAEILSSIFTFVSFFIFYRSINAASPKRLVLITLSALSYLAAVLAKELALILPVLFAAYVYTFKKKPPLRWVWIQTALYAAVLGAYFILRLSVLGKMGEGGIGEMVMSDRIYGALMSIFIYARLILLPYGLHMAYQLPAPSIGGHLIALGAITLAVLAVLTWFARKHRVIFFGFLWFWIFLIPVLNIFVLMNGPTAEHWLYNAIIGFWILVTATFFSISARWLFLRKMAEPILAAILLAYAATTFHSNSVWKDEITLFNNVLKYTKYFAEIYNNLGTAYVQRKMFREAEENFKKAVEVDPNFTKARDNLETLSRQMTALGA